MDWLKRKLIDDVRKAHTFLSVQAAALLGVVALAYDYMPALQQYLPAGWVKWGALLIIAARLIKQQQKEALHA
ncbi:MAG: hypothetical protein JWL63_3223 [Rhodocyclales bacterium]|nr:hypothetical protein [Rhodocyclales bacterium]